MPVVRPLVFSFFLPPFIPKPPARYQHASTGTARAKTRISLVLTSVAACVNVQCALHENEPNDSSSERLALPSWAQLDPALSAIHPQDRIRNKINERTLHQLVGTVHALARPENDTGRASANQALHGMILVLQKDATQQAALDQLTAAQQDPQSPQFHQWLTPESYGEHFGVSLHDQQQLVQWLKDQGFTIDHIAPSRWTITFSGTAAQVEQAFHTEIE
jgi:hypothetical protein